MRTLFAVALVGIGSAVAVAAPVPKELLRKSVTDRILGTWKMAKNDNGPVTTYTFTITFKKAGQMTFHREYPGQGIPSRESPGKFKTGEPDKEYKLGSIDWKVQEPGGERGEVSRVIKLTADELVFEDPDGLKEYFTRVKEK